MQKKKVISIVALLVVVLILSLITSNLLSNRGKSNKGLDDFLVADTATVDRIVLTESTGYSLELVRQGGKFVTVTGDCIQEEMIKNILHTFTKVAVRSFVPKNSISNLRNNIRVNYRKVQIFQDGEWLKTWWIGNNTPDFQGTYALLELPGEGVSDIPVILEMRGLRGSIETRFTADPRAWVCTNVFSVAISDIKKISVSHSENEAQDFTITRVGKGRAFKISDFQKKSISFDTLKLVRYLDLYKNVNFESVNYTLNDEQIDSMKRNKPWAEVKLELTNGKKLSVDAYRMKAKPGDTDLTGIPIEWDANRLWGILSEGSLVKIQYLSFDPIFVDISYFGFPQAP
jgi:uncharacterized protein YlzI (FlbEa/FlbD family)